ncbi:histone-lysine N-methyltransferase EHMT1-like [Lethenteron reissneri]|uniref:histone-lysine N-methyltransferase EHMT1-like n=1 Tax=Lethenteron reissneri TaxID=7753 RepID=UPI002AB7803D|nr:histone-lysine N-methyltransferase EHMT1-like [Lethenteron reissneri]
MVAPCNGPCWRKRVEAQGGPRSDGPARAVTSRRACALLPPVGHGRPAERGEWRRRAASSPARSQPRDPPCRDPAPRGPLARPRPSAGPPQRTPSPLVQEECEGSPRSALPAASAPGADGGPGPCVAARDARARAARGAQCGLRGPGLARWPARSGAEMDGGADQDVVDKEVESQVTVAGRDCNKVAGDMQGGDSGLLDRQLTELETTIKGYDHLPKVRASNADGLNDASEARPCNPPVERPEKATELPSPVKVEAVPSQGSPAGDVTPKGASVSVESPARVNSPLRLPISIIPGHAAKSLSGVSNRAKMSLFIMKPTATTAMAGMGHSNTPSKPAGTTMDAKRGPSEGPQQTPVTEPVRVNRARKDSAQAYAEPGKRERAERYRSGKQAGQNKEAGRCRRDADADVDADADADTGAGAGSCKASSEAAGGPGGQAPKRPRRTPSASRVTGRELPPPPPHRPLARGKGRWGCTSFGQKKKGKPIRQRTLMEMLQGKVAQPERDGRAEECDRASDGESDRDMADPSGDETQPPHVRRASARVERQKYLQRSGQNASTALAPPAPPDGDIKESYTATALRELPVPTHSVLSPHTKESRRSSDMEEGLQELPLCSCRMEAPKNREISKLSSGKCMATESTNGQLTRCLRSVAKQETMRPSSHDERTNCCPGCGFFCSTGTFLECQPDVGISHRFHVRCVSRLNGSLYCPHCGEEASSAREVTVFAADAAAAAATITGSAAQSVRAFDSLHMRPGGTSARMRPAPEPSRAQAAPPAAAVISASAAPASAPSGSEGEAPLSEGEVAGPATTLKSGAVISATGLPSAGSKELLEQALITLHTERPKKLRFNPKQLYLASRLGELQKVLLMLVEGLDPNVAIEGQRKRTPMHGAAERGHVEVLHTLVQLRHELTSDTGDSPRGAAPPRSALDCVAWGRAQDARPSASEV